MMSVGLSGVRAKMCKEAMQVLKYQYTSYTSHSTACKLLPHSAPPTLQDGVFGEKLPCCKRRVDITVSVPMPHSEGRML